MSACCAATALCLGRRDAVVLRIAPALPAAQAAFGVVKLAVYTSRRRSSWGRSSWLLVSPPSRRHFLG